MVLLRLAEYHRFLYPPRLAMFNPLVGRSQEFFRGTDSRRIANQQTARRRAAASQISSSASNSAYVAAARKGYEARKREQQAAQNAANAAQRSANTAGFIGAGISAAGGIAAAIIA